MADSWGPPPLVVAFGQPWTNPFSSPAFPGPAVDSEWSITQEFDTDWTRPPQEHPVTVGVTRTAVDAVVSAIGKPSGIVSASVSLDGFILNPSMFDGETTVDVEYC